MITSDTGISPDYAPLGIQRPCRVDVRQVPHLAANCMHEPPLKISLKDTTIAASECGSQDILSNEAVLFAPWRRRKCLVIGVVKAVSDAWVAQLQAGGINERLIQLTDGASPK